MTNPWLESFPIGSLVRIQLSPEFEKYYEKNGFHKTNPHKDVLGKEGVITQYLKCNPPTGAGKFCSGWYVLVELEGIKSFKVVRAIYCENIQIPIPVDTFDNSGVE